MAAQLNEQRKPELLEHSVETLVVQRILLLALACGWGWSGQDHRHDASGTGVAAVVL
ncbi:MAG: hypothetical protein ACK2UO_11400 [Caldilineaceae bacterium]|jgi:hypothetical protein